MRAELALGGTRFGAAACAPLRAIARPSGGTVRFTAIIEVVAVDMGWPQSLDPGRFFGLTDELGIIVPEVGRSI